MKIAPMKEAGYPACPTCYGPLRRPCQVEHEGHLTVICAGCFRLLMILGRMEIRGWISRESYTNALPNVNEKEEA